MGTAATIIAKSHRSMELLPAPYIECPRAITYTNV
jgi:hypothetical protein